VFVYLSVLGGMVQKRYTAKQGSGAGRAGRFAAVSSSCSSSVLFCCMPHPRRDLLHSAVCPCNVTYAKRVAFVSWSVFGIASDVRSSEADLQTVLRTVTPRQVRV
jgi:methyl coenzyme M reductase subunit C